MLTLSMHFKFFGWILKCWFFCLHLLLLSDPAEPNSVSKESNSNFYFLLKRHPDEKFEPLQLLIVSNFNGSWQTPFSYLGFNLTVY